MALVIGHCRRGYFPFPPISLECERIRNTPNLEIKERSLRLTNRQADTDFITLEPSPIVNAIVTVLLFIFYIFKIKYGHMMHRYKYTF